MDPSAHQGKKLAEQHLKNLIYSDPKWLNSLPVQVEYNEKANSVYYFVLV